MIERGAFRDIQILVVGDVMLDRYWFGDVDRISPEAPVAIVNVTTSEERAGGAANVAINVASLGAQCRLLSVVGDDEAGRSLQSLLDNTSIKVMMRTDPDATTTVKLRLLSQNQQLLRADFERRPSHEILSLCLRDFSSFLGGTHAVVISDYAKGGLLHIKEMISLARAAQVPIIVDPKGPDFAQYKGATVITPNLREFQSVVGEVEDDNALVSKGERLARDLELDALLVTRSNKGMTLIRSDGSFLHSSARTREVYDVSGAGDTVIGAFAVSHAAGLDDEKKLAIANAAAGVVIGKLGTASVSEVELLSAINND